MSTPTSPENDAGKDQDQVDRLISSARDAQEKIREAEEQVQESLRSDDTRRVYGWLQRQFKALKRFPLEDISDRVKHLFAILTRALSSVIVFLLIIGSFRGIFYNKVIFQDFSVPESYQSSAITGDVVKNKIVYHANQLFEELAEKNFPRDSTGKGESERQDPLERNVPREDVEIMGVSLNALKGAIRSTLGLENALVSGILIDQSDELVLELTVSREEDVSVESFSSSCVDVSLECLDTLVKQAAIYLLGIREPLLVAFHHFEGNEYNSAEPYLRQALVPENEAEITEEYRAVYARGYHTWGQIHTRRAMGWRDSLQTREIEQKQDLRLFKNFTQQLSFAKEKYRKAIALDQDFPRAKLSLANALVYMNRDRLDRLRSSQRFQDGSPAALKDELSYADSLQLAIDYYNETNLRIDSTFGTPDDRLEYGIAHLYLGTICDNEHNTERAKRIFSWVGELKKGSPKYNAYLYWQKRAAGSDHSAINTAEILAPFQQALESHPDLEWLTEELKVSLFSSFTKGLAAIESAYGNPAVDTAQLYEVLAKMSYFYYLDWVYEDEVWYQAGPETQLYNFSADNTDSASVSWSACSLTPDPKIIGRPLGIEMESLWHYLLYTYFDSDSDNAAFVQKLAANHSIIDSLGSMELREKWYQELQFGWADEEATWSYEQWYDYQQTIDFGASISYSNYLDLRLQEGLSDSLSYAGYREKYADCLASVQEDGQEVLAGPPVGPLKVLGLNKKPVND